MAAFIQIFQGDARKRTSTSCWGFVNTTVEDEYKIMVQGFLPLILKQDSFDSLDNKTFNKVYKRFFEDGKFFTIKDWENLQNLLVKHGYTAINIPNDGQYWQPIMDRYKTPTKESWLENAASRLNEFTDIVNDFEQGKVSLSKLQIQPGVDPMRTLFNTK